MATRFRQAIVPGSSTGAVAVAAACVALGDYLRAAGASPRVAGRAEVLLEELALNALRHGGAPEVRLEAFRAEEGWTLCLEDAGAAFDPLAGELPAPAPSLEEARIGGLGLPLVRRLSKRQRYDRAPEGVNRLELVLAE